MAVGLVSVFCSTGAGIGQTTTLVRVALRMCHGDRRILIVDADPGENRVRDLFPLPAASSSTGPRQLWRSTRGGVLDLVEIDGLAELTETALPPGYDHILVDAPVPRTSADIDHLAALATTIVVTLALNQWSIEGAAELARQLLHRAGPVAELLVVGVQTQEAYVADGPIRAHLTHGAPGHRYRYLEIPHSAEYAAGTRNPIDVARGADQNVLDEVYTRLAIQLAGRTDPLVSAATVVYGRRCLAWAEWISDELAMSGVDCTPLPAEDLTGEPFAEGVTILVVWPCDLPDRAVAALLAQGARLVIVDDSVPTGRIAGLEWIDLTGLPEQAASPRLREALGLAGGRRPPRLPGRFPRVPAANNLAPRNTAFVGRDTLLSDLRDTLRLVGAGGLPLLLHGPPGIGKTEIALEYCHRFAGDYSAIWWLSADSPDRLRTELGTLANLLDLTIEGDVAEAVRSAMAESDGWLLVVDDVRADVQYSQLLPHPGPTSHLFLTSREPHLPSPTAPAPKNSTPTPATETTPISSTPTDPAPPRGTAATGGGEDSSALGRTESLAAGGARSSAAGGTGQSGLDGGEAGKDAVSAESGDAGLTGGGTGDVGPTGVGTGDAGLTGGGVRAVEVPPFTPEESRALLLAELPQMPSALADQIGWTVGNVPLAVYLAGRLLTLGVAAAVAENLSRDAGLARAVQRFGDDYRDARERLLATDAEVTASRIALEVALAGVVEDPDLGAWQSELDGLGAAGRSGAVEWILDAFALLTTKGVSMELLRSPGMQRRLTEHLGAGEPLPLSDALLIDLTVWRLARHGLLEVDLYRAERPVRQHATLRELTVRRMGEERRATLTRELWVALREYVPGRPIGPKTPDPEVWQNLLELRTWEMPGRDLRRWFVYRVYDLVQAGDKPSLDLALDVGERARALWAEDSPSSPEYLRLLSLLAQAYRTLGDYERARTLAKQALREQRRVLGHDHPRTLLSADAHAAILRATGDFGEALVECRTVAGRLASLLGPDHYATIQAEHNLALSESLSGNAREALRIATDRFERGRAVVGDTPGVWLFAVAAARYHRALGEPAKSYSLLKDLLTHAGAPGFRADLVRSAESGLAVSERMLGLAESALERDTRLLAEFTRHTGARSLLTLACRSSLAADLIALGKHGEALTEAEACLAMFVEAMGDDHPFTQIPRMQVSICLRAAGELERARAAAESALDLLVDRLEYPHPLVFSARVNLANVLVAQGESDAAAAQERDAIEGLDEINEPFHPARRTAVENLNDTQAPGGSHPRDRLDVDLEIPQV